MFSRHLSGQRHVHHLHDEVHIVESLIVPFHWQEGMKYVHSVVCKHHASNVNRIEVGDAYDRRVQTDYVPELFIIRSSVSSRSVRSPLIVNDPKASFTWVFSCAEFVKNGDVLLSAWHVRQAAQTGRCKDASGRMLRLQWIH